MRRAERGRRPKFTIARARPYTHVELRTAHKGKSGKSTTVALEPCQEGVQAVKLAKQVGGLRASASVRRGIRWWHCEHRQGLRGQDQGPEHP